MHISSLSLRETFLHLLSCSQNEASVKPLPRSGTCTILKRMLWHKQWSAKVITNYGPCGALAICLLIMYTTAWLLHRKQTLLLAGLFCHIITATGTGRIPGKLCLFLPIAVTIFVYSPFKRSTCSFCHLVPCSNHLPFPACANISLQESEHITLPKTCLLWDSNFVHIKLVLIQLGCI